MFPPRIPVYFTKGASSSIHCVWVPIFLLIFQLIIFSPLYLSLLAFPETDVYLSQGHAYTYRIPYYMASSLGRIVTKCFNTVVSVYILSLWQFNSCYCDFYQLTFSLVKSIFYFTDFTILQCYCNHSQTMQWFTRRIYDY